MKMRVLDLFSGIGGFSLGLERTGGFETVAFCEIEDFPCRVLAKHWPDVPIHRDVRKLKGEHVGPVDVICGGYPCQPFSLAGKRGGSEDDRHLWPEMHRLVDELRPAWVVGENVAGHIGMGLDDVLSDLDASGYACRTLAIPACAVGALHRRDRVWIIANTGSQQHKGDCTPISGPFSSQFPSPDAACVGRGRRENIERERTADKSRRNHDLWGQSRGHSDVADADDAGRIEQRTSFTDATEHQTSERGGWWQFEPDVGRVAHGVPSRVDRLRGLGNAVVPQIPEMIGRAIMAAEGHASVEGSHPQ